MGKKAKSTHSMKKSAITRIQKSLRQLMGSWFETLSVALLSILAGVLLFPFTITNLFLVAAIFVFLIIEVRKIIVLRRKRLNIRSHVIASTLSIFIGFAWLLLSPFWGFSTKYMAVLPNKYLIYDSSISTIGSSNKGLDFKILVLADPLRPYIAHLLRKMNLLDIKVLRIQKCGNTYFVIPPLETCYTHIEPTSSASKVRVCQLLHFFNIAPKIDMSKRNKEEGFAITGGWTLNVANTFSGTYCINSVTPLWQAVDCDQEITNSKIQYAALLDYALTAASVGQMEKALSSLFLVGDLAPSHVELVRLTSLLAHWSRYCLGGTLGELQSVSYYREAVDAFKDSVDMKDYERSEHSQLILRWAQRKLLNRISRDEKFFAEDLEDLGMKIEESHRIYFEDYDPNNIEFAVDTFTEMMSKVYDSGYYEPYMSKLMEMDVNDFCFESARASTSSTNARLVFEVGLIKTISLALHSNEMEKALFFNSLKRTTNAIHKKYRPNYQNILEKVQSLLLSVENEKKNFTITARNLEILGFHMAATLLECIEKDPNSRPPSIPRPPDSDWWTRDYIDWFMYALFVTFSGEPVPPQFTKRLDVHFLTRDRCGSGRIFLPGLGLAFLLTERSGNHELATVFERDFIRAIGKSPDEYFKNPVRTK